MATPSKKVDVTVAIIGAGFSGLGMGKKLHDAGIDDFVIFEAASEVGGTWRDSKYPGAAVDVPNHLYSYSFAPNPNWTRMFSDADEIQRYIVDFTDRFGLRSKIKFNTKIVEARFDEANNLWEAKSQRGEIFHARFVVGAIGPFAEARIPDIPGLEKFQGLMVHTAKWDRSIDLKGKRVAVVGSGASAIQVVPAIQPIVKELKVFQRTPSWVVPKADYEYSELEKMVYRYLPFTQKIRRAVIYGLTELLATAIVWDTPMTDLLERVAKRHMAKAIKDPELLRKVTPDYRLGRTRMLISNDWYPALAKPNVELIAHGVEALGKNSVIADGKEYLVDVIIWATGYRSPAQGFPFPLIGVKGRELNAYWADGAKAYKGVTIAGFPNLFTLMGPNTGPGHTSVLVYVEAQQEYIVQAIQRCLRNNIGSLAVREDRQEEFNQKLREKMKKTTWGNGGHSWYYTKDGLNTTLYPGFATDYVLSVRRFDLNDYFVRGL